MTSQSKNPAEQANQILDSTPMNWDELIALLAPQLTKIAHESSIALISKLELDKGLFGKVSPKLAFIARQRAAELVGKRVLADGRIIDNPDPKWAISQSTRSMLKTTVTRAIDEGWTAQQLRKEIVDSYGFSSSRALMIARTERSLMANRAEHETALASQVIKLKQWTTSESDVVCEVCSDNDQVAIPLDSSFPSGDSFPPAHPNCSCSLSYS